MRKALIVGINKYASCPLNGCVNDATEVASILRTNANGTPNFDVKLITDIETKSELKELIMDLFNGNNDIALFYFSGHGLLNELGGYIVTPDYKKCDEGISMDELLNIVNKSKAKNKIIILDCCYSGALGSPTMTGGTTAHINEGVTILTASKSSETASEVQGHGVFTHLLLDALRGGAANLSGDITPGSIYAHVDQSLGAWDQRPVFKTNVTRFTSLRKVDPPVPQDVLKKIPEYFQNPSEELKLDKSYEYTQESAIPEKVQVLKNLQKLERVGLVVPVGEEHMYYVAINSKTCKLTPLGCHYWRLARDKRI